MKNTVKTELYIYIWCWVTFDMVFVLIFLGMERLCPPKLSWTKLPTSAKVSANHTSLLNVSLPMTYSLCIWCKYLTFCMYICRLWLCGFRQSSSSTEGRDGAQGQRGSSSDGQGRILLQKYLMNMTSIQHINHWMARNSLNKLALPLHF